MRTPILVLMMTACSPDNLSVSTFDLFLPSGNVEPNHAWIEQAQQVEVLLDVQSGEAAPDAQPTPERLRIQAFDLDITAELSRIDQGGEPVWVGDVVGDPLGEVVLAQRDGVLAGSIHAESRVFTLGASDDGTTVLSELALDEMPADAEPVEIVSPPDALPAVQADGETIDLLVVYTADARQAVGGTSAMEALIGVAVAETNQGYVNSGVSHRVSLVGTQEVTYSESGFNWQTALGRLAGTSDGYVDDVHALRDSVGADQVTMLVDQSQYCGLAYLMSSPSSSFASNAFALVYHGCATGYYSFGHELGHNMGSTHDHANGSGGAFPYSYGYQSPNRAFRTVMAYNCPGGGCTRVNHWSNPGVNYSGESTGVAGTGSDAANNAASLDQTASIVSAFRGASVGGGGTPASVVSPASGSTLSSTTLSLTWSDVNADEHAVSVGSSPGGTQYDSVTGLSGVSTTTTVTGLPDDGSTVHVRIWSLFGQDWVFTDTTYTAVDAVSSSPAVISSPTSGATLTSDSLTVSWGDTGARQYRVFAGRYPGDRSLGEQGTTGTQVALSGLPRDSRPLYLRLFSETDAGWLHSDLLVTSAGPQAPAATTVHTPSPGATLTESNVDFEWSDVGADEYHLFVGYRPGSREVFSGSAGSGTEVGVGGLPTDAGDLHVRLWTRSGTEWTFTDAAYVAPEEPSAVPVAVQSPTPGTSISGGSVRVSWSDVGADEYSVFVGLAQGNREIMSTSMGTQTQLDVTGLPQSGRAFWVRVWSRSGNEWTFTDAQYTGTP